jgi:DNA-binding winged helix-turn-helix (wHTH) protein
LSITFAEFDVDPNAGILSRSGVRIKLQDLPFRLLVALLHNPGVVVSREQLRAELWGAETFVDAEAGLNTAIAKLREALGDDAETPRFIETVPKRGYRFIGQVSTSSPSAAPVETAPASHRGLWMVAAAVAIVVLSIAGSSIYRSSTQITIAVVKFHNETGSAEYDRLAGTLTDAVVVSLAQDPRYGIIGNSPLLRTERIFADVQRIGTALDAQFVVLGQLQRGDAGLVTRAHFIRVSDQKHLWASKIDIEGATNAESLVTSKVAEGVAIGLSRQ